MVLLLQNIMGQKMAILCSKCMQISSKIKQEVLESHLCHLKRLYLMLTASKTNCLLKAVSHTQGKGNRNVMEIF